ncbi:MAG: hypothetical protein ABSG68_17190 [Thermoguttaceae bacterium]
MFCILTTLFLSLFAASLTAAQRKTVIPLDFASPFDHGRCGETLAEMIWKKLEREGGFVIPDSMLDVRETCTRNNVHPGPEMPLGQVKKIIVDDFGAQIGIWGSVQRAAGHEEDVYDLVIKCVDFSVPGEPKIIYQCKAQTRVVSEIPHVYVKQLLDALYERKPGAPPALDVAAEENWRRNANLVVGGDFQNGAEGVPAGWEATAGQQREPLGRLVRWVSEGGSSGNKLIRFTFDANVGDNEGVMYYSRPFAIEQGATYRFQCRWRSTGSAAKVFIKCYDEIGSQYTAAPDSTASNATKGKDDYVPSYGQMREVYRSQQNLSGPPRTWNTHTADFTPKHSKYAPRWCRVMLYAYLGAGVVDFDDVVIKQIAKAPSSNRP